MARMEFSIAAGRRTCIVGVALLAVLLGACSAADDAVDVRAADAAADDGDRSASTPDEGATTASSTLAAAPASTLPSATTASADGTGATTAETSPSTAAAPSAPSTTGPSSTVVLTDEDGELLCNPPPLPTDAELLDGYRPMDVCGWQVFMSDALYQDQLAVPVYDAFVDDLQQVIDVVPVDAALFLRSTPIWFELDEPEFPGGVYHPSEEWLVGNGYPPKWAKGIQFGNARNFLDWPAQQPAMLLHEFTHALHDQRYGFFNGEIFTAFEQAMAAGLYDTVEYIDGGFAQAYATTNDAEYLAELTEAYFWINDFYPFDRQDLAEHDPDGLALVESIWQIGR